MSILNALAQRPILNPVVRGAGQDAATASSAYNAAVGNAFGKLPARLPVVDAAGQGEAGSNVSLSQQALNARVGELGDKTIDVAQRFLQSFATALFGDAAKGARFNFDSVSVAADTSLSAAVVHGVDASGNAVDGAAINLEESAAFVGHGQLLTNDGQSYDFDIEVAYRASVSASASASTATTSEPADASTATPEQALVGKQLPPVKYPGSLADLFKLLGRQLDASSGGKDGADLDGQLSMRLIRLVNSAALLAPRPHPEMPQTPDGAGAGNAERSRALASYAVSAPGQVDTSAGSSTDIKV
ncbi:MAG: hypothetical protein ACJ8HI_05415 [Massilia sp.]